MILKEMQETPTGYKSEDGFTLERGADSVWELKCPKGMVLDRSAYRHDIADSNHLRLVRTSFTGHLK